MFKKILFANGRPTPPITLGGDSVGITILLNYLQSNGYCCQAFGTLNPDYATDYEIHDTDDIRRRLTKNQITYKYVKKWWQVAYCGRSGAKYWAIKKTIEYSQPFSCKMVRTEFFLEELDRYIQENRPDLIITQVSRVTDVITLANKYHIPVMLIVQDLETNNLLNIGAINSSEQASVLFISKAVKKQFAAHCQVPTYLWHHPVEKKVIEATQRPLAEYITMINPIAIKGGRIFHDIAKKLPNLKFMVITNWYDYRKDGIDFSDLKNVVVVERQDDMDSIYQKTKLLLVPSLWQEAFGRVVIEAGSYGIPTIASDVGGLKEAVGKGGMVIKKYLDIGQWLAAIKKSLAKDSYPQLATKAHRNAMLYETGIQGRNFELIMKKQARLYSKQHPTISVIVVTRNRPEKLHNCLTAIALNTIAPNEIIVVNEGDQLPTRFEKIFSKSKFTVINLPAANLSVGRNAGVAQASTEIVCFTDDDCLVSNNWIAEILKSFEKYPECDGVFGDIKPHSVSKIADGYCPCTFSSKKPVVISQTCLHWTTIGYGNNMSFRTKVLRQPQPFKTWLSVGSIGMSAEDAEIALLLLINGHQLLHTPKVIVHHDKWLTPKQQLDQDQYYDCGQVACYGYFAIQGHTFARPIALEPLRLLFPKLLQIGRDIVHIRWSRELLVRFWWFCRSLVAILRGMVVATWYSTADPIRRTKTSE